MVMSRRDAHLEALLRHLGAAYYESLHGRASAGDVARARVAVEERLGEQPATGRQPGPEGEREGKMPGRPRHRHGRWHTRVHDVMTTDVVTVDRITTYKEIARLLARHHISAVPVLVMGRRVAGIVSEDDLFAARDAAARPGGKAALLPWPRRRHHPQLTAGDLMSSPPITIHPDAPVASAVRLMHQHHVKRLPVVNQDGTLIGIVSRRDLLRVFLRPDADIAQEARDLLTEVLPEDPAAITVTVRDGVVTLAGRPGQAEPPGIVPAAVDLVRGIDGVVDVVDELSPAARAGT
jgi:CBS domain-containing protein